MVPTIQAEELLYSGSQPGLEAMTVADLKRAENAAPHLRRITT